MNSFLRRAPAGARVTIEVDGEPVAAVAGDSVATALLAVGRAAFAASGKTGNTVAPYCLIGMCFGCLCEIDGRRQAQACLEPVREGLVVRTARAAEARHDR